MSADRRTLAVAAVAMVVLVAVGVVSASVFTGSACDALVPDAVPAPAAGEDVEAVLAEALGDLDGQQLDLVVDGLESLAGGGALPSSTADAGALRGAVDVATAATLTPLGDALAATGETTTTLPAPGEVAATVAFGEDATVAGSGSGLHVLALVNELTGQVDAIVPLDTELQAGTCLDTAQVGVPLTFHLGAGDGQLLLLRMDDDADHPEIELRDADGPVWSQRVEVGAGPPGVLGERVSGHLADDVVVTARRSVPDDPAPALTALDRADGEIRWERSARGLDELAPAGDEPLQVGVVDVADDLVLVSLSREEHEPVLLVALDADDGTPVWTSDLAAEAPPRAVGSLDGDVVLLAPRAVSEDDVEQRTYELVRLDPDDGAVRTLHSATGERVSAAVVGSQVVIAVDESVTRLAGDGTRHAVGTPVPVEDLQVVGDQLAVLLRHGDGGAVVWMHL